MVDKQGVVREGRILDLLVELCRVIAQHPGEIKGHWAHSGEILYLEAHQADLPRLIGDKGRTRRALKTLGKACSKSDADFDIEIRPSGTST